MTDTLAVDAASTLRHRVQTLPRFDVSALETGLTCRSQGARPHTLQSEPVAGSLIAIVGALIPAFRACRHAIAGLTSHGYALLASAQGDHTASLPTKPRKAPISVAIVAVQGNAAPPS